MFRQIVTIKCSNKDCKYSWTAPAVLGVKCPKCGKGQVTYEDLRREEAPRV